MRWRFKGSEIDPWRTAVVALLWMRIHGRRCLVLIYIYMYRIHEIQFLPPVATGRHNKLVALSRFYQDGPNLFWVVQREICLANLGSDQSGAMREKKHAVFLVSVASSPNDLVMHGQFTAAVCVSETAKS
jgi:hypothetical protein